MKQVLVVLCLLLAVLADQGNRPVFTHVTALYDIGRGNLTGAFHRPFELYLSYFELLLQTQTNLIVFGTKQLQEFVWQHRKPNNTIFILKEMDYFKNIWYYPHVQRVRQEKIKSSAPNRQGNPQFTLEMYNVVVFSKMYLLEEAALFDKFNSDFLVWTDGGLNHVFTRNMVYPVNHLMSWFQLIQPQWLFFTSDGDTAEFVDVVTGVITRARLIMAGFFGGSIQTVKDVRCTFQNVLRITLEESKMDSEESVFNVLSERYPYLYPMAVYSYPRKMYNQLHAFTTYRRQPIYPRLFSANFDSEGNINMIVNKTVTRFKIAKEEKNLIMPRDPTDFQIRYYKELHQVYSIIKTNQIFAEKILQHEAGFLVVLVVLYICSCWRNKRKQVEQVVATN